MTMIVEPHYQKQHKTTRKKIKKIIHATIRPRGIKKLFFTSIAKGKYLFFFNIINPLPQNRIHKRQLYTRFVCAKNLPRLFMMIFSVIETKVQSLLSFIVSD